MVPEGRILVAAPPPPAPGGMYGRVVVEEEKREGWSPATRLVAGIAVAALAAAGIAYWLKSREQTVVPGQDGKGEVPKPDSIDGRIQCNTPLTAG